MNNTKICAAGEQIATRDFQSRTFTDVSGNSSLLLELKKVSGEETRKSVYANYAAFIL
ncbi:hypothetical protein LINPERHAP1_LOCUS20159 [Linum perenne]